jgi:hypothetical protein
MSRKHSTALTISAAMGGAAVAAFLSMGTAHADPDADPFEDLLGGPGTPGLSAAQIADNVSLDQQLVETPGNNAAALDTAVDTFESTGTAHPLTQLIDALDSNAFQVQFDPDISGYLTGTDAGGYLVPDDFLGYLAVDLDADLLNPTGLGPLLLGPIIDLLLGFPASP